MTPCQHKRDSRCARCSVYAPPDTVASCAVLKLATLQRVGHALAWVCPQARLPVGRFVPFFAAHARSARAHARACVCFASVGGCVAVGSGVGDIFQNVRARLTQPIPKFKHGLLSGSKACASEILVSQRAYSRTFQDGVLPPTLRGLRR